VNSEFEGIWNVADIGLIEVLALNLHGGCEGTNENPQSV
jgi:hypothetical protein